MLLSSFLGLIFGSSGVNSRNFSKLSTINDVLPHNIICLLALNLFSEDIPSSSSAEWNKYFLLILFDGYGYS